jgi:hypothetical protein
MSDHRNMLITISQKHAVSQVSRFIERKECNLFGARYIRCTEERTGTALSGNSSGSWLLRIEFLRDKAILKGYINRQEEDMVTRRPVEIG